MTGKQPLHIGWPCSAGSTKAHSLL